MEKIGIDGRIIPTRGQFKSFDNGGKGSGNFGHAGRPGEIGGSAPSGASIDKEATERLRKDIESWVEGKRDEHDPTALKSILKSVDDSMSRAGLNPKDSVKIWKKLVKEKKESVAGTIVKPSSKAEGLQAIVGMVKTHLANPDKAFRGDEVVPYYRKAYDGLRQLSDFFDGEDDVFIRSDIKGPYIELRRKINSIGGLSSYENGGKGSGNFGHAGRPGEVGGSAPAGNGQSKADPEEKKEIKGGTKAEHEAIMEMVKSYAVDERGIDGVYEDVEAAAYPHEDHTTFQKAKRWLEAGGGEASYEGAYKALKDLYGDSFKPETYLTKGGDEENGDWKYKDGQPYVWSTYLYKFAKAIADEMDKRKRGNSLEGTVVNAVIEALNGGKGSGNFGHAGRPGEVGGSAPAGTSSASSAPEGKQMPLASFMKLAKSTPLELRQTSFHGGEPRNPDWRSVGKVQTTGMYLGDSYLDLPKASLTEIEWDDEKGVGKLKCYDAGFRDYNEEEKAALAEWKKITDTDEYRDMALRDAYTDTSSTYWKEKSFWEDKGMEYMFHTKKGGKLRTQNPDKKDDRGFSVDEIRDDSIKGRLWGEYEIRRKENQDNSLENIITNAIVEVFNGGKGSGNFGHSGRPGLVGGSGKGGGSDTSSDGDDIKKKLARLEELEKKDREEELNADEIDELHDLTYDKDVKYALSHPEKKSVKEREKFKLTKKEVDAVSDVLPGLHASDNVGRNIITSQEKREARDFVRKASKEELADKFFDKNTTARERAALYYVMDSEYNYHGLMYVGDDLLYGDKREFLASSARKKEHKKSSKSGSGKSNSPSLKGKSLYEKVHMIEPGDEVHIKPSSKVPNFPKEIKVDYVEDGTIHYGSSETSDGYTYPAWAIDDIKKIIRKK